MLHGGNIFLVATGGAGGSEAKVAFKNSSDAGKHVVSGQQALA